MKELLINYMHMPMSPQDPVWSWRLSGGAGGLMPPRALGTLEPSFG